MHDRLDAPWVIDGAMNWEFFDLYIETQLAPTLQKGDVVILDKPMSPEGFTNWFRKQVEGVVDNEGKRLLPDGLSPHGLRKATCRRLAEAGCSAHKIMAISGHQTLAEVTRYTVAANRLHLAKRAVAAMERKETRVKTVKPA